MFSNMTSMQFLILLAGVITAYYLILAICYTQRSKQPFSPSSIQKVAAVQASSGSRLDLIGRPVEAVTDPIEIFYERDEDEINSVEMLEDDDRILVKEAEKVVENIQEVINHISSLPPNPEEVFTKINAIVRAYRIFENTEYFEPINQFIALTVSRDCHIEWTEPQLLALWK